MNISCAMTASAQMSTFLHIRRPSEKDFTTTGLNKETLNSADLSVSDRLRPSAGLGYSLIIEGISYCRYAIRQGFANADLIPIYCLD